MKNPETNPAQTDFLETLAKNVKEQRHKTAAEKFGELKRQVAEKAGEEGIEEARREKAAAKAAADERFFRQFGRR